MTEVKTVKSIKVSSIVLILYVVLLVTTLPCLELKPVGEKSLLIEAVVMYGAVLANTNLETAILEADHHFH